MHRVRLIPLLVLLLVPLRAAPGQAATRSVFLDSAGVIRWKDDRTEVSLYGANYILPSASDYRALMEKDGTSWSAALAVDSSWAEREIPLSEFKSARGVLLPAAFPGNYVYWVGPAAGRGEPNDRPRLAEVERLQLSLRRADAPSAGAFGVELERASLRFR